MIHMICYVGHMLNSFFKKNQSKNCYDKNYVINLNGKRHRQRKSKKEILSNIFNIMLIRCIFITNICDDISKLNLKFKKYFI